MFLGRQKAGNKEQRSATLAYKVKQIISLGRGRRKRRCAREEKEEGLLRTVDCVFKSCLLIVFLRIVSEFAVYISVYRLR